MQLSRHRGQGQRRGLGKGHGTGSTEIGSSVVVAPLYDLPLDEFGVSIGWDLLNNKPARDMWDFRTIPNNTGTVHQVPSQKTFAQALLDVVRGDIIEVEAGTTHTGNFQLDIKTGTGWIIVRSSAHASLPALGSRVTTAHTANMFTLRSTSVNG